MRGWLTGLVMVMSLWHFAFSASLSSITQYGITWTFDHAYSVGQFANGDYWVVGPVIITNITPAFDGSGNGWEANPNSVSAQGFDSRICGWNSGLVPGLPYTAQPITSIVKTISRTGNTSSPHLQTAAVLTVLASVPPDSGATVFRPPYFGTTKPLYSVDSLHTELLPSLAPVANTPALSAAAAGFQQVQLDHMVGSCSADLHPANSMANSYGSWIATRNNEGALRLMLNDASAVKKPLLINFVQYGIDVYAALAGGCDWPDNGGNSVGRKLPITFAAVLLNNQTMKNTVSNAVGRTFNENASVYTGRNGTALFGQTLDNIDGYWRCLYDGSGGARTQRDPYGCIDGGEKPGDIYQLCCLAAPFKGMAMALQLVPELKTVWHNQVFLGFPDRWVNFGAWTQPDTCAPTDGNWANYGITFGPNGSGGCIRDTNPADGTGRFPSLHGSNRDGGGYGSAFVNAMWTAYRNNLPAGLVREKKPRPGTMGTSNFILTDNPVAGAVTFDVTSFAATDRFSLHVYDVKGVLAKSCSRLPGSHLIIWDKSSAPPGIYFYSLQIDHITYAGKVVNCKD